MATDAHAVGVHSKLVQDAAQRLLAAVDATDLSERWFDPADVRLVAEAVAARSAQTAETCASDEAVRWQTLYGVARAHIPVARLEAFNEQLRELGLVSEEVA